MKSLAAKAKKVASLIRITTLKPRTRIEVEVEVEVYYYYFILLCRSWH